jgi:hypothetical protein
VTARTLLVFESPDEAQSHSRKQLRRQVWQKLTAAERQAVGLPVAGDEL